MMLTLLSEISDWENCDEKSSDDTNMFSVGDEISISTIQTVKTILKLLSRLTTK